LGLGLGSLGAWECFLQLLSGFNFFWPSCAAFLKRIVRLRAKFFFGLLILLRLFLDFLFVMVLLNSFVMKVYFFVFAL
jgi:hypothetical protein